MRPGLSPEDEEVKRRLVRCHPWAYSELIRSDIPGSSGAKPTRLLLVRSSPPSIMKPSLPPVSKSSSSFASEPLISKLTRGELRARLEVLAKKKRSVNWKTQASPEGCPPARGKILKVGVSSSLSSAVGAGDSSGREAEPSLEVLPISVGVLRRRELSPFLQCQVTWEGVASALWGMRTLYFLMWSSPMGLFPPFFTISTSRRWMPCPLRRL